MSLTSLLQIGALLLTSFLLAAAALWLLARLEGRRARRATIFQGPHDDREVFLFDAEDLIDATPGAADALAAEPGLQSDWHRFLSAHSRRFEGLDQCLHELPDVGRTQLRSTDGRLQLTAEWKSGLIRISITPTAPPEEKVSLELPDYRAMETELETLRETARSAPFLVWAQRPDGTITWANNAYLDLAQKNAPHPDTPPWPPARVFDLANTGPDSKPVTSLRIETRIAGEAESRWFECFEVRMHNESLFMAVSADKVVKAETALRDFVQTLTKTFAHLTVGLAVFDKQRRLTLFNPALMDLTSLPADFLSSRPTLHAVLNRLREKKMLPEPKDYKSWIQQFQELETEAINGTYEEIWTLANGSTYRVVGRPHPDGALAFLFEDISAEISLTRRFRAELETGQAVLDALDEAIVVFSPAGALTMSNKAYNDLWAAPEPTILGQFGIIDATRLWGESCVPSPVWGDVREFISTPGARSEWTATVRMLDGRAVECTFKPVAGGSTMATFRPTEPSRTTGQQEPPDQQEQPVRRLNLGAEPASA